MDSKILPILQEYVNISDLAEIIFGYLLSLEIRSSKHNILRLPSSCNGLLPIQSGWVWIESCPELHSATATAFATSNPKFQVKCVCAIPQSWQHTQNSNKIALVTRRETEFYKVETWDVLQNVCVSVVKLWDTYFNRFIAYLPEISRFWFPTSYNPGEIRLLSSEGSLLFSAFRLDQRCTLIDVVNLPSSQNSFDLCIVLQTKKELIPLDLVLAWFQGVSVHTPQNVMVKPHTLVCWNFTTSWMNVCETDSKLFQEIQRHQSYRWSILPLTEGKSKDSKIKHHMHSSAWNWNKAHRQDSSLFVVDASSLTMRLILQDDQNNKIDSLCETLHADLRDLREKQVGVMWGTGQRFALKYFNLDGRTFSTILFEPRNYA